MPPDYYRALGIERTASPEEVRAAYRRLARAHHPDVNGASDAAARFAEISEAYEVLNDPAKRRRYDRLGGVGVATAAGGRRVWPGAAGAGPADLGSIFEEMFGGFAGSGGGRPFGSAGPHARPAAAPGRDVEHELTVGFMTAALGGRETVRISADAGRAARTMEVTIPPGIETGARLRVRGGGVPGRGGGPAGDLLLRVRVGDHPWFRRTGLDLQVDVPITIAEAGLGATVRVPLLRGVVEIRIPPGASSGGKLRVPGRGITDAAGRTGDFLAVVRIVGPRTLSARARGLLEDLAGELQDPRDSGPWSDAG